MQTLKLFLYALPIYIALDLLWIGVVANRFYLKQMGSLARQSKETFATNWSAAVPVYLLFAAGIAFFVLPKAAGSVAAGAGWGALFGLVVYGVYDFTNLSLLKDWSWRLTIVDVLWGAAVGALVSAAALTLSSWIG